MQSLDSFGCKRTLKVAGEEYDYYSVVEAARKLSIDDKKLPYSIKVVLENLLRNEDGKNVTKEHIEAIKDWDKNKTSDTEISYMPARVLMQDFTGVPAVVDLAAMRDGVKALGGDPKKINPLTAVDLVIDHSVQVDKYGSPMAFKENVEIEYHNNRERYEFLKWGQKALDNFRAVPPGTGICHQVNLEYLAKVVWTSKDSSGRTIAYPDTVVGTDSHTTMINGLAVLGWGVGGIEAEAVMLGQPISMVLPEVIGFRFTGKLKEGVTATDLVLTVTQMLRAKNVVGKFVEFYGPGLSELSLSDKATIANMAPEYGATCGFFAVSQPTIDYLHLTSRDTQTIELVKEYSKAQNMWRDASTSDPEFTDTLELDLGDVQPSLAGPKRPQDKVLLKDMAVEFKKIVGSDNPRDKEVTGADYKLRHGDVVIAAITSCTNTSNPSVMLAAGLVAKKAVEKGMKVKPWVKTSLAPGSQVVTEYFKASGLDKYLDEAGFHLVGYGCTTCIGNSGPLKPEIEEAITKNDLTVASVLSGNRNFEGRVHPLVKANYLASPPLVVAYAFAGNVEIDLVKDPIGKDKSGNDIYMKDIWPSNKEIEECVAGSVNAEMFQAKYKDVFKGDEHWRKIDVNESLTYGWKNSTYINNPPYFQGMTNAPEGVKDVKSARILALLGDSITTDHISPAGNIAANSPAAKYLEAKGIQRKDFNSYGSRRGNHEIMMRGTFANIRIKNEMIPGTEGGFTKYQGEIMPIYDAAMKYKEDGKDLVVIAGKEYGTGSSRDWAAKGTNLLGVKAVIAESFERIHRSNLVGMGVVPLAFTGTDNRKSLGLTGEEEITITGLSHELAPKKMVDCEIKYPSGDVKRIQLLCRVDTDTEVEYMLHGGILKYVIRKLIT